MKKKLSIIALLICAFVLFPKDAKAEADFSISCNPGDSLQPGQTTTCTVKIDQASPNISAVRLAFSAKEMSIGKFQAGTEFTDVSNGNTTEIKANNPTGAPVNTELGKITATLNKDATSCGSVCVVIQYKEVGDNSDWQNAALPVNSNGDCKAPAAPTTPEQPQTGNFASYAILIGGAAIALGIITYASRSTKFYRV